MNREMTDKEAEGYAPTVRYLAKVAMRGQPIPRHLTEDDLFGAGLVGLMKAWNKWTPKGGANFRTFARAWILQEIKNEIRSGTKWRGDKTEPEFRPIYKIDVETLAAPEPEEPKGSPEVRMAVDHLPALERELIERLFFQEQSAHDAMKAMNLATQEYDELKRRALSHIKNALQEQ